jgi:hypothetical protein
VAGLALLAAISTAAHAAPDPLAVLTREVSKLRGLRAKKKLEHETVDRAELRRRLLALANDAETQREAAAEGLALARWGLIPITTDYIELRINLLTDQIAGYYDARTKKLTITKDPSGDAKWAELVLAHEIVHGLQDQTFDLAKLTDLPPTEADAALARHAVIEGDGIALMIELALSRQGVDPPWGNPNVATEVVRAMASPTRGTQSRSSGSSRPTGDDSLDNAPLAIREEILFPYREGFAFVASLLQQDGWSGVDKALRKPPRSTEQILHPEKYWSDEKPRAVKLAPAYPGYSVVHTTTWGEHGVALFLRSHGIPADAAAIAAAGWGGDRVLVLAREGDANPAHAIGVARLVWDDEPDAVEAYGALTRALDVALTGTTVETNETRTSWLGLDGTVTTVLRTGTTVDITLGVPVYQANK